jgi:hypothetical protein
MNRVLRACMPGRGMLAAFVAMAVLFGVQMTALATCPANDPCIWCTPPPGCSVSVGINFKCCSTSGTDCCQYECRNCDFSTGAGCPADRVCRDDRSVHPLFECDDEGAFPGTCKIVV